MQYQWRKRIPFVICLIVLIPLGLYTKAYNGPGNQWVSNSAGGIIYEIFWCLLISSIWINSRPFFVASGVFIITCILEFLQLWHPMILEIIRATFIGRTVLGTTFVWSDFLYYFIGSGIGGGILYGLKKNEN